MKSIWKYPLHLVESQEIQLPAESEILYIGEQQGELFLWALVDPKETEFTVKTILIKGTGEPIEEEGLRHLRTVITEAGLFVWHIFVVEG